MGRDDRPRMGEELRGEPLVDPAEHEIVHERRHLAHPPAEPLEHGRPEPRRGEQQLREDRPGDPGEANARLGDPRRRVGGSSEEGEGGDGADLPGGHAVQQDLLAVVAEPGDADAALEEEGAAGGEDPLAEHLEPLAHRGGLGDLEPPEQVRGHSSEDGIGAQQELAVGGVHRAHDFTPRGAAPGQPETGCLARGHPGRAQLSKT